MQAHTDLVSTRDHVAIGNHIARLGIRNHPGAQTTDPSFTLLRRRRAEELLEEGVCLKRTLPLSDPAFGINIDHGRQDPLEHRREARQRLTFHRHRQRRARSRGQSECAGEPPA